ncbi:MAG: sterol desaturase family protein [Verrucomicrobia bacterium]|nr:sterol desaturase family protein [Verrucomicrobiota bacterium]
MEPPIQSQPLSSRLIYPAVMGTCLLLHVWLRSTAWGTAWNSYLPVLLGAALITVLERYCPYRRHWSPDRSDVTNDLAFMMIVQVVLPKFLTFFTAIVLVRFLSSHDLALSGLWPQTWPVFLQVVLMLLTADFFRYWLHRASHEWSMALWRLHAVHHSPHKLYWLNVGRFHPIEKAFQFLFDALPFILVGVSEEVLGTYFVFYAVNGFFQHCNIELRLGVLNYVISGPELHRWHHSHLPRESNRNYGNNLILWDLLFRTWFLPQDLEVGRLGLVNRGYPLDFLRQMKTPFIKNADQVPDKGNHHESTQPPVP